MSVAAVSRPSRAAPAGRGALAWLKENLFSSLANTILTLLIVLLAVLAVPPIFEWALVKSVWGPAPSQVCKEAEGACWAFIYEKHRLILFGRYPFAEQWRPLVAMVLLFGLIGFSCFRRFWKGWLGAVWAVGLVLFCILMWGGLFGLSYVETALWGGLPLTLILSSGGIVLAFPFAILLALGRRSQLPIVRAICVTYIELIRGVPLVTLLFMASFMFPLFMPHGVQIDAVLRALVAILLFAAAYLAEVVRGGLQAIPKGQYEAANAVGLTYWQATRKIILPQAIRIVIPPIVNSFIATFKDTSLVVIVSLTDLLLATRQALSDPLWRGFFVEGYVFIALIYLVFCYAMSRYSRYLETELHTGRRKR